MARTFVSASSNLLSVVSVPVGTVPLTMACWFKPVALATGYGLMSISDATVNNRWGISTSASNNVSAICVAGGVGANVNSAGTYSNTGWHHACVVFQADGSNRAAFVDGGGKGTVNTASAPSGLTTLQVGGNGGGTSFLNGQLALPAIWSVALSDGEVAALATGLDPRLLQSARGKLAFFAPLIGNSPETDTIGSRNLTVSGATRSDDPTNLIYGVGRPRPNGDRYVYAV